MIQSKDHFEEEGTMLYATVISLQVQYGSRFFLKIIILNHSFFRLIATLSPFLHQKKITHNTFSSFSLLLLLVVSS